MECFIIDHRQIFSEAKLSDYDVINEKNKSACEVEQKMKIKNNMGTFSHLIYGTVINKYIYFLYFSKKWQKYT